jgi:hypothetical protein
MLVSTSGLAGNSTIAGGSCRNPKVGGKRNKFVTDQCCHVDGQFFYIGSELATEERFEKLLNWRTSGLDMNDYRLPDIFE